MTADFERRKNDVFKLESHLADSFVSSDNCCRTNNGGKRRRGTMMAVSAFLFSRSIDERPGGPGKRDASMFRRARRASDNRRVISVASPYVRARPASVVFLAAAAWLFIAAVATIAIIACLNLQRFRCRPAASRWMPRCRPTDASPFYQLLCSALFVVAPLSTVNRLNSSPPFGLLVRHQRPLFRPTIERRIRISGSLRRPSLSFLFTFVFLWFYFFPSPSPVPFRLLFTAGRPWHALYRVLEPPPPPSWRTYRMLSMCLPCWTMSARLSRKSRPKNVSVIVGSANTLRTPRCRSLHFRSVSDTRLEYPPPPFELQTACHSDSFDAYRAFVVRQPKLLKIVRYGPMQSHWPIEKLVNII